MHKYSLRLRNQYWRAEKYNDPDDVITGQTIYILGDKLEAPADSIKQASQSNGLVRGYYISRVPRI
ncbi:hypothetical protein [Lactiplantibacillus plantarum]|uniref:hypothetical protein n=1 Tax=Lactiplantibacillus plantarum TaxID=1590 RepID=UPI0021CB354C|nr:hypothetical protein [Lactiplantibacillus plantarum]